VRELEFNVEPSAAGERLDQHLTGRLGDLSRGAVQRLIREGLVRVDGSEVTPSYRLQGGEAVEVEIPADEGPRSEEIPVPLVFEDEHLLVVDKPYGLVVHPGAGNESGTLVNALLDRGITGGGDPDRPGVVHRLDRDTSGLLVFARSEEAYRALVASLKAREVERVYRTIVVGRGLPDTGTVDSPVGRDPDHPVRMTAGVGRPAVTHFEVVHRAERHTMLRVRLETGRTHQIRVHLSAIGYPVYADPLYGQAVPDRRLWLHAAGLSLAHPVTGERLSFESPIPPDLREAALELDEGFPLG
jgi:23S rRNA pseudouridine1911/1915/1917 synthase